MAPGDCRFRVKEAIFDRDTATFLSMNPRYVINWKDQKIEGEVAYDGGKNPKWYVSHELDVGTDLDCVGMMTFTFLDEEDLIVTCEIPVREIIDEGTGWFPTEFDGEPNGKVCIEANYDGLPVDEPVIPDSRPRVQEI